MTYFGNIKYILTAYYRFVTGFLFVENYLFDWRKSIKLSLHCLKINLVESK